MISPEVDSSLPSHAESRGDPDGALAAVGKEVGNNSERVPGACTRAAPFVVRASALATAINALAHEFPAHLVAARVLARRGSHAHTQL